MYCARIINVKIFQLTTMLTTYLITTATTSVAKVGHTGAHALCVVYYQLRCFSTTLKVDYLSIKLAIF